MGGRSWGFKISITRRFKFGNIQTTGMVYNTSYGSKVLIFITSIMPKILYACASKLKQILDCISTSSLLFSLKDKIQHNTIIFTNAHIYRNLLFQGQQQKPKEN